jgi:hypothetical protein
VFARSPTTSGRRWSKVCTPQTPLGFRRCQILVASARGERAPRSAAALGIDDQTVLDALHACNTSGLASLHKQPARAHHTRLVVGPEAAARSGTAATATAAHPAAAGPWSGRPRSAWPRGSCRAA